MSFPVMGIWPADPSDPVVTLRVGLDRRFPVNRVKQAIELLAPAWVEGRDPTHLSPEVSL